MKQYILVFIAISLLASCGSSDDNSIGQAEALVAAIDRRLAADSIRRAHEIEIYNEDHKLADSLGPVAVTKVSIVKEGYGKQIVIRIKNKTKKKIDALTVHWSLSDAYDEPVNDLLNVGMSEEILKPDGTDVLRWPVNDMARRARAHVSKVHFADSTTWDVDDIK